MATNKTKYSENDKVIVFVDHEKEYDDDGILKDKWQSEENGLILWAINPKNYRWDNKVPETAYEVEFSDGSRGPFGVNRIRPA
jgi:hypothetical protein